jgi:hypothetical protein
VQRIRQATETIAGLTHRVAALRDIVTVDYPAGNRTTVPMVSFKASTTTREGGSNGAANGGSGANGGSTADGGAGGGGAPESNDAPPQIPRAG